MNRRLRNILLTLGVSLLILPAAVSDGHERSPDAGVAQSHVR
jgi:hypothetical protein